MSADTMQLAIFLLRLENRGLSRMKGHRSYEPLPTSNKPCGVSRQNSGFLGKKKAE